MKNILNVCSLNPCTINSAVPKIQVSKGNNHTINLLVKICFFIIKINFTILVVLVIGDFKSCFL